MSNKYLDLDGAKYMLQKYHDKISESSQTSNPFDSAPINTVMHSSSGNIFGNKWLAWNETRPLDEFDVEFANSVEMQLKDYYYSTKYSFGNDKFIKVKREYNSMPVTLYFVNCSSTSSASTKYNLRYYAHYYASQSDYDKGKRTWSTNTVHFYGLNDDFTAGDYLSSVNDMCWYNDHLYVMIGNTLYKIGFSGLCTASSMEKIGNFSNFRYICSSNDKIIMTIYDSTLKTMKIHYSTDGNNFIATDSTLAGGTNITYVPERDCFVTASYVEVGSWDHAIIYEIKNNDLSVTSTSTYDFDRAGLNWSGTYLVTHYARELNGYIFAAWGGVLLYLIDDDSWVLIAKCDTSNWAISHCGVVGGNFIYSVNSNRSGVYEVYFNSGKISNGGVIEPVNIYFKDKWHSPYGITNVTMHFNAMYVDEEDAIMIVSAKDMEEDEYVYGVYDLYGIMPDFFDNYTYYKYKK